MSQVENLDLANQERRILYQALHIAIDRLSGYTRGNPEIQYKKVSESLINLAITEINHSKQNHLFLKEILISKIKCEDI